MTNKKKVMCEGCEEHLAEDTIVIDGVEVKVCRTCYQVQYE